MAKGRSWVAKAFLAMATADARAGHFGQKRMSRRRHPDQGCVGAAAWACLTLDQRIVDPRFRQHQRILTQAAFAVPAEPLTPIAANSGAFWRRNHGGRLIKARAAVVK
jgi:hypothetical protein